MHAKGKTGEPLKHLDQLSFRPVRPCDIVAVYVQDRSSRTRAVTST